MESTNGKQCPKWALIEVTQREPLFTDASICGDWCTEYNKEYDTCIHYAKAYFEAKRHETEAKLLGRALRFKN